MSAQPDHAARINGYVKDASSGEPLSYANIVIVNSDFGAAADVRGYYVIPALPPGNYTIRAMMLGYAAAEKNIELQHGSDLRTDFELIVQAIEQESITVTAERTRFEKKVEVSRMNLSSLEIKTAPAFIEADVFRSLQLLPGISAQNDFSAALIVRGGSPDENLILLDGTEVYNPYHIGGVFSTFNSDAIADAEFLAGGFPAEFGGRISSVLQITTKEGNSREGCLTRNTILQPYWDLSHIKGEINVLSSKILAEGPALGGSWILSYRRTYFDKLAEIYYFLKEEDQDWKYYFKDTQFKWTSDLNTRNRLTYSYYGGNDQLKFIIGANTDNSIDFDWIWGNNTQSLAWRWVPNSSIFSTFTVSRTIYDFNVDLKITTIDSIAGEASDRITVRNTVDDYTVKGNMDWYLSENHTISTGIDYKNLSMTFKQELSDIVFYDQHQSPYVVDAFIQDRWQINPLVSLQIGSRLSKYELHKQLYFQPRIGFKYRFTKNFSFKGSWGKYVQFLFTTNDDDEILRIVDFWEPIPRNLKAQSNQHYILGIEQWLGNGFTGSVEVYYKPYDYVLDLNPANNPGDDSDDFIAGTGHSQGIELLLKRSSGKLTGWIGYSYSAVEKRMDFNSDGQINKSDGEIYAPKYDRPHTLNVVGNLLLNSVTTFSLTLSASSGQPYTPVIGKVYSQSGYGSLQNPYQDLQTISGERNSARYPAYYRIDAGYIRSITLFGLKSRLKIQIINVTNQFNVLIYSWDHSLSPSRVTATGMFPIVPSFGWEFEL